MLFLAMVGHKSHLFEPWFQLQVEDGGWKGGKIVILDSLLTKPTAADCAANFVYLSPILKHSPDKVPWRSQSFMLFFFGPQFFFPDHGPLPQTLNLIQVPSGYFLTDVFLYADMLFKGRLLIDPEDKMQKTDMAADEAIKLKHLVGAIRTLWRSSESAGHHPRVTALKQLIKPSPRKVFQLGWCSFFTISILAFEFTAVGLGCILVRANFVLISNSSLRSWARGWREEGPCQRSWRWGNGAAPRWWWGWWWGWWARACRLWEWRLHGSWSGVWLRLHGDYIGIARQWDWWVWWIVWRFHAQGQPVAEPLAEQGLSALPRFGCSWENGCANSHPAFLVVLWDAVWQGVQGHIWRGGFAASRFWSLV